jgi:CHAT domain-containing protein
VEGAKAKGNLGAAHFYLGDYSKALANFESARVECEALGDLARAARNLSNIGMVYDAQGRHVEALASYERAYETQAKLGESGEAALTLSKIGIAHRMLGNYKEALSALERALAVQEELGDRRATDTLLNIGNVRYSLGDYREALSAYERGLADKKAFGDRRGEATAMRNIGSVSAVMGDLARALSAFERARALCEAIGDKAGEASCLGNIGAVQYTHGDYADALATLERAHTAMEALGSAQAAAEELVKIAAVHNVLGRHDKALTMLQRAWSTLDELGAKTAAANVLGAIAVANNALGNHAEALANAERARALLHTAGAKREAASALETIGIAHLALRDHEAALLAFEQALAEMKAAGSRSDAAQVLGNIGVAHEALGDVEKATSAFELALRETEALGLRRGSAHMLGAIAGAKAARGDWTGAVESARRGAALLPLLFSGLGDEQSATARDRWEWLLDAGVRAGVGLGAAAEVHHFLERGRAASLLEALGNRKRLAGFVIPEALRDAETKARDKERVALHYYRRALDRGEEVGGLWKEVEAARDGILEVVQRTRREARAQADLVYPEPDPLPDVQATLRSGEALVLYALLEKEAYALVVTAKQARIVALGETEPITAAAEALEQAVSDPGRRGVAVPPHETFGYLAKRLRKLAVEPLELEAKRVLVSPDGPLCYVPFAVLTDAEVASVPSATTYRLLRGLKSDRGTKVLALGDPDYEAARDVKEVEIYAGGHLEPLPASGAEAEAVGDVVLLGKRATLSGLREALDGQERWRAVHVACHGLVDPERPVLSSLALTGGFLRCLDVYRSKIPADLVVLSACETAKGKVYKTEGVVGWTRAFLFAGAPRVIVSLWKVEDEATRALMEKFYEAWKGGKVETATALKRAQEYVRSKEKWRHPYFWAAWQLWGLPD